MNKPVKFTLKVKFTGNKKALKKRIGFKTIKNRPLIKTALAVKTIVDTVFKQ
jgi:hypothetical protein